MPIVRDGEKFACKQCVQGHRVSGCNHIDRPLQHVNKKGRPVSQCPHCRGLRRARQTHIKCDCGDRRHSRNTSSESASLDEDNCKCKCFLGKKCTCALKKEIPESDGNGSTPSPRSQRSSPMRWMPARRSESAIPSFSDTFQAQRYAAHQTAQELGLPLPGQRPYALGSQHAGQRSVDSLPLSSSSSAGYQAPVRAPSYDHQFLNPDYGFQQQLHVPQGPGAPFNDQSHSNFPVPLDQNTIDKTLSPHNKKRYSMNDFSMLAGMSQHAPDPHMYPSSTGGEAAGFQFQHFSSHDFAFAGMATAAAAQHPPPQSVTSADFAFPALSRSSSGTTSDPEGSVFLNPMANSSQPVITIDPTWGLHNFEATDKGHFDYPATTYQETPSEYSAVYDDPALPVFDLQNGNEGVNPFSTEPRTGGVNDFPFPGQVLPDRSMRDMSVGAQSPLDMDFRFPSNELAANDSYSGSPLKHGWSPIPEDMGMNGEMESGNLA